MPAPEASSNLRELLRVREEDSNGGGDEHRRNAVAKLTLAAVLGNEKRQGDAQMSRTLLDIIRDESAAAGSSPYADGPFNRNSKTSWKSFKDRLRLRRAGAAWTSSVHIPTSDVPMRANSRGRNARQHSNSRLETAVDEADADSPSSSSQETAPPPTAAGGRGQMSRMSSTRLGSTRFTRVTFNLEDESNQNESDESPSPPRRNRDGSSSPSEVIGEEEEGEEADPDEAEGGEPPVRMSLMALLEETDRQAGVVGPTYASSVYDEDDEEDDDDEDENEGGDGHNRQEFNCCVCMVRHKGAAFIPCGHTFCRLCSRELWVSRGNCPICNGFILEILDIF